MCVVVADPVRGMEIVEPSRLDAMSAWVRGAALDRDLASGRSPEQGLGLAVRAAALVSPRERRLLADGLERVLTEAGDPSLSAGLRTPAAQRSRVRAVAPLLSALVARLRAPGPVSATGMARVKLLLTEGGGPLHGPGPTARLERALREAAEALDADLDVAS